MLDQILLHEACVANGDAEGQGPRAAQAPELFQGVPGPGTGGHGTGQLLHIETVVPPGDVAVVHVVGDSVVVERAQQALADPVADVTTKDQVLAAQGEQVRPVRAIRSCRQAQEESGFEPGQELPVRAGGRVMEFVHHDVVETVPGEALEVRQTAQGLDRGEEQVRPQVLVRPGVETHAGFGAQAAEGAQGLAQDLLAVGHEEHPREPRRIEGGQPGLSGSGGHDHQAGKVALLPGPGQRLQGPALDLMGFRRWWDRLHLDGNWPPLQPLPPF